MKKLVPLLLLILALTFSAHAELIVNKHTNDFTLSSPNNEQLKMCSCETRVDTLYVQNTGEFYGTYDVRVASNYPSLIRLSETQFQLAPHHTKEVLVYIEESCGISGTFNYLVTAVNSYGRIEQLERTIRADQCQIAHLEVEPGKVTTGTCQSATYQVTTKNVGTYADSFTLDFGAYNDAATTSMRSMYLKPDQSYTQNVSFTLACSTYGEFDIPFTLTTGSQGVATGTTRQLTVTNDYDVSVGSATRMDACALTQTHIPIGIKNDAPLADEVTLALSGPQFVMFENGERTMTLTLEANASAELQLVAAPSRANLGEHEITLTLTDAYGGISKTREVTLGVDNCYDAAVQILPAPAADPITQDLDCCGEKTYYVSVQNKGDREQVFDLTLDGPSAFTLDETSVRVRPSESVNVALRADLPCTDESYDLIVTAAPSGQPQASASAKLTVTSLSQRACYAIAIDEDELTVREDANVIPLIVRNTGLRGGEYMISMNSSLFTITEQTVTLQPGETKALHLEPLANLTTQEKGRSILEPTLTHEGGTIYNEFVGIKLRGFNALERFGDWLSSLSLAGWTICARIVFVLFLILVILVLMLLAIYMGKLTLSEGLSRRTLTWLKIAILILIAVLLLMLAFAKMPARDVTHERIAVGNHGTTLEWYQNERFVIDLSVLFEDPDDDTLTFTTNQPENINVAIDGDLMTLTPDHNFAGENTMVITASDSKGGMTDSPIFTLRVVPRRDVSFAQWVGIWCMHLAILALIAILIVLFFMTLTIKERRDTLQRDNVIVVVPAPKKRVTRKKATKKSTRKRATKKVARKKTAKKAGARTANKAAQTRALVRTQPSMIMVEPSARLTQPVRETREGQTVNIAVGSPLQVPGAKPSEILLVASTTGNTVHTPYCMIARRIPKSKRIAFSTRQEALKNGLVPCKGCRPF